MFKRKNLWFSLALTTMMLLGGSMTAYASETVTETTEVIEAEETVVSETEDASTVIVAGEASAALEHAEETAQTNTEAESIEDINESAAISEESTEGTAHDHVHEGLQSLGIFRTTGYCPCYQCSEGWGRSTSTGAIAKSGHTIAVDPRVIPYGTKLMIGGVVYTAEDRGGGVKGNHIDIFFDNHAQTRQHGSRHLEVFLVG